MLLYNKIQLNTLLFMKNMLKKIFYFLILLLLLAPPVFPTGQLAKKSSAIYDKIANPQKPTNVYIIKDIHCHYLMQKQIVNELEKIHTNNEIELIAVEGSCGELSFDILRSFPDAEILNSATDSFMKTADLLGVECFASKLISQEKSLQVIGLEDIELYAENKSCFLSAVSNSNIIKPISVKAHSIAKNNILEKLPSDKSDLLKILYNNDTENFINLIDYLKAAGINVKRFKTLNKYHTLNSKLKTIRRDAIENESKKIGLFLKNNKFPNQSKQFNQARKKYYAGIISFDKYIHTINSIMKMNKLNLQTKGIDDYIALADKINRIDFYLLNEEISSISSQIELSITNNIIPDELIQKKSILALIEKLYDTSLRYSEYQTVTDYFNTQNPSVLSAEIYELIANCGISQSALPDKDKFVFLSKPFVNFYNLASQRDKVMAGKFLSSFNANKKNKSHVIVAGGFHTDGLSAVLTGKGINHKIIVPNIPKGARLDNNLYIKRITGTNKRFDLDINDYFMGLQVWLNFSSTFPDDASRTSAQLFKYKLISFIVSKAPYESPSFKSWLDGVSEDQGINVSAVARNREGVICSIANKNNPDDNFLFEINIDTNGTPVFRHNKYYENAIGALYMEPSNKKLNEITQSIYQSAVLDDGLIPGTDNLNDFSRFMFMLRINNPRAFYEISRQISDLLKTDFPDDKIDNRAQAVMRFNLAIDEVETVNMFYENRLISLNQADEFINARRAIVETAYNLNGSNDNFSLILDLASKQAELSASLLFMQGVIDSDWLIDHYLALFSWLVSQNSTSPEIANLDFPKKIFDQLPPVEFNETSLLQRIESGIDHIKSDKYDLNRSVNFAQIAVERLSMPHKTHHKFVQQSPEELMKSLISILNDYQSESILSPVEFDSFIEKNTC